MSNEPRKATDVLLELESKIDNLLSIVRSQDLNIKVLSNKLNTLLATLSKQAPNPVQNPPVTVEAVDSSVFTMVPEHVEQIPIESGTKLPLEQSPQGFRRTSRPETYAGDNAYLPSKTKNKVDPKFPVQIPKSEVIVPKEATDINKPVQPVQPKPEQKNHMNSVPVQQRVVDKNSKSVFLADVEIFGQNGEKTKTRTNGAGKWMAALAPGNYKVILTKRDSLTKEKVDLAQDIKVDGKTSPLELPMLIFK